MINKSLVKAVWERKVRTKEGQLIPAPIQQDISGRKLSEIVADIQNRNKDMYDFLTSVAGDPRYVGLLPENLRRELLRAADELMNLTSKVQKIVIQES